MYCFFDENQKLEVINISPGEYFISVKGMPIHTLLSSCVSAVIFDSKLKIGGMNHFMISSQEYAKDEAGNMEILLEGFLKNGSKIEDLEAKILGGSVFCEADEAAARNNISFVENFLNGKNIKIVNRSVGGGSIRKIYFYPEDFKVLIKKIEHSDDVLEKNMSEYTAKLKERFGVRGYNKKHFGIFNRVIKQN